MRHIVQQRPVRRFSRIYLAIIAGGILFRITYIWAEVDLSRDYYWEYGEIVKNLHAGKGYSLYRPDGAGQTHLFDAAATPLPSAYMPPGYVFFLWPFFLIQNIIVRSVAILGSQIVISAFAAVAVFEFTDRFVQRGAGIWGAAVYSFLPEFVYATSTYTPTVHYHLGVIVLLFFLQREYQVSHSRRSVAVAVICVLLIFFRSEFAAFVIVAVVFLARRSSVRHAIFTAAMIFLMHLPWQVRNYIAFDRWVPLTTSGGLNFYRGHNGLALGAWGEDFIAEEAKKIPEGPGFETELSALYFDRALDFIRLHPVQDLQNAGKKALHYWFINPDEERSRSLLYVLPWLGLLFFAVFGIARTRAWESHRPVLVYLVYATWIAVTFFVLPRYQSMMKVVLVPFAATGVKDVLTGVWMQIRGSFPGNVR